IRALQIDPDCPTLNFYASFDVFPEGSPESRSALQRTAANLDRFSDPRRGLLMGSFKPMIEGTGVPDASLARQMIASDPRDYFASVMLALPHIFRGEIDAALAEADRYLRADPESANVLSGAIEFLTRKGNLDQLDDLSQRILEAAPDSVSARTYVIESLLAREKYDETRLQIEIALEIDPRHAGSLLNAAR